MSSTLLSHRKPASAGALLGSYRVQEKKIKGTPCTCLCVHYGLLCYDNVWGYVCRSVSSLNNILQPREDGGSFYRYLRNVEWRVSVA